MSFRTSSYNIVTWPSLEWEFVVAPREGVKYPHTPSDRALWGVEQQWSDKTPGGAAAAAAAADPRPRQDHLVRAGRRAIRPVPSGRGQTKVRRKRVIGGSTCCRCGCCWDEKAAPFPLATDPSRVKRIKAMIEEGSVRSVWVEKAPAMKYIMSSVLLQSAEKECVCVSPRRDGRSVRV